MKNLNARNKGILTGSVMVIVLLLLYYGLHRPITGASEFIVYAIYTAGILWCLYEYKKNTCTKMKFKDYFATGFKTFIIVVLIMVLFTFIFYKLNMQLVTNSIEENNTLLLKEGNKTPVEIAANAAQMKKIFMPMMLGITTFKYLILGTLITAIGAGFLSQDKA
jgi:hypothetical protein